ncbi:MAG: glutamine synthetase [Solirubrobacteraceae bacterium]|jgi:glutamine synthetase|nr:glutamine synthetase [Solirubrobacteraceae bacterium]
MTLDELKADVLAGGVDTVLLAMTDMQGRLQGKRLTAPWFLDSVVDHGAEACNYLLAVDVDMNTVGGYGMSGWERGYGDFELVPDLATLCRTPWLEGTAMCLADVHWADHSPVVASPRQILRAQLDRLAEHGYAAYAGTELEFMVFDDSYEQAWDSAYRNLTPANRYNVDYSLLGTARVEPLLRRIRNAMMEAGMVVEDSKGECNYGQHEINFLFSDALRAADQHVIYKNGAKEIAAQEGKAITFMAKYDEREGNSCHIHLSLRGTDGSIVFDEQDGLFDRFVAGMLAGLRELTLFLAPNINSYKRYAALSFAPTTVAWGHDNRTCALRVVGHGAGRRVECRVPGADVNPYLALSALIAAGLHGIDAGLELEPALEGNAYEASERPQVPSTLRDARDLFAGSAIARDAFGPDVVEHYLNNARIELEAYDAAVTDWERFRGFERL